MSVLSPPETVHLATSAFALAPPRQLETRLFNVRLRRSIPANARLSFKIENLPRPQWVLLLPIPLFFLLLGGVLYHFLNRRMPLQAAFAQAAGRLNTPGKRPGPQRSRQPMRQIQGQLSP